MRAPAPIGADGLLVILERQAVWSKLGTRLGGLHGPDQGSADPGVLQRSEVAIESWRDPGYLLAF
jgi:hypothetical protein